MLLFAVTGILLFLFWEKDELFWSMNGQHSDWGDLLFKYGTYIGDGLVMILIGLILIVMKRRKIGVLLILSFLLSGLIVQVIKKSKPEPRPGRYFSTIRLADKIHRVDGHLHTGNNSFPSGHTTTAFAMFSLLAFNDRRYSIQVLFFLLALAVGYSRIYLGQHFFGDVWAGSMLGYLCSFLLVWLLRNKDF